MLNIAVRAQQIYETSWNNGVQVSQNVCEYARDSSLLQSAVRVLNASILPSVKVFFLFRCSRDERKRVFRLECKMRAVHSNEYWRGEMSASMHALRLDMIPLHFTDTTTRKTNR